MLEPGGKNWINKYFQMVEQEGICPKVEIPKYTKKEDYLHASQFQTGISFGYAVHFLFAQDIEHQSWTPDERLKLLLFESLLQVYLVELQPTQHYKAHFISSLVDFYKEYNEKSVMNIFRFFKKEEEHSIVERILGNRVHIRKTLTNVFWVNYLSNSLIYLDVLAYQQFLQNGNSLSSSHEKYARIVLETIALASYSDGTLDAQEKTIMDVFFSSSTLDSKVKKQIISQIRSGNFEMSNLALPQPHVKLLSLYLLDLAVLTVYSDAQAQDSEIQFLFKIYQHLNVSKKSLDNALVLIERFILENDHRVSFLRESSTYDRIYRNFSRRWIKILGRNKNKLVEELKQNKELIALVNKSLTQELSTEEKEKVKHQFVDLVKSMPALAIFMLPGGALLLPIILRIIPDLIPSSFKQNKLDK